MATKHRKGKSARKAKAAKPKAERGVKKSATPKVKRERKEAIPETGRVRYKLKGDMPDKMSEKSIGFKVLSSIKSRGGKATSVDVAHDVGKIVPSTLRFYLGKFQRTGLIAASDIAS